MTELHQSEPVLHSDGSQRFSRDVDLSRQSRTAHRIEELWKAELRPVGELSYLDYLVIQHERPIAWVEVIERAYTHDRLMEMGGVWLKLATYLTARMLAEIPLSVKWRGSYIFWQLPDGLYVRNVLTIPQVEVIAWDPRGAVNDVEPAIVVDRLRKVD